MDKSELRQDPLTREWTILNENRATFPVRADEVELQPSPFGAGLERFASHSLFQSGDGHGWKVRVVPNRVPVFALEGDAGLHEVGLFSRVGGFGAHEIVVEDPGGRRLFEMDSAQVAQVAEAWRVRIEDLTRDGRMSSFSVFKNEGRAAGQTIAHSISQIVAMGIVAPALRRKLDSAQAYFAAHQRSLFADILAGESSRVVFENAGFVVFCPYASRSPFELAIWPKRHNADFHRITADEVGQLGDALRRAVAGLHAALEGAPYQLALTTAPARNVHSEEWPGLDSEFCWHVNLLPRLSPTGGIEVATGCHVNGVWPEVAADFLRRQAVWR